ncbi:NAD(P)-binding protein [Acephala macrosclerotiorum]|nr:NAD(P)-binding protein [Acephala macrosclerotiorum]
MLPPKRFLIAGATGRQSGAVVTALLSDTPFSISPKNIWAITRDAAGASAQRLLAKWPGINIDAGDLNNPQKLFEQLDKSALPETAVFFTQAHGPTELEDAKGFIDAAASRGVTYFVYSSVGRGGRELSDADPSYCKTFSDKFYIKGKRMQVVTTRDIGRWAAEGLVRPDRTGIRNEVMSIASDELSFEDINLVFKRKTGKGVPVTFGWAASLMIWLVKDLNTMFSFINERGYGADLPWLKERLEPTTFEQWIDTIQF